jgi:hypothetical protein
MSDTANILRRNPIQGANTANTASSTRRTARVLCAKGGPLIHLQRAQFERLDHSGHASCQTLLWSGEAEAAHTPKPQEVRSRVPLTFAVSAAIEEDYTLLGRQGLRIRRTQLLRRTIAGLSLNRQFGSPPVYPRDAVGDVWSYFQLGPPFASALGEDILAALKNPLSTVKPTQSVSKASLDR